MTSCLNVKRTPYKEKKRKKKKKRERERANLIYTNWLN